jgi:hypothetical protein
VNLNKQTRGWRALSGLLSLFLTFGTAFGQSETALKIVSVEGNAAEVVVSRPATKPLSLRVVDVNNRPVAGATVVFTSPTSGPSGSFSNGSNSMIVFTNQQGVAVAQDYRANSIPGEYQIQVQAAYMGDVLRLSIRQTNVAPKKSPAKLMVIAAVAAGAAIGLLAAKGSESSSSPQTPATTPPTITLLGSSVRGSR